jgi:DNA-binding XRE family transcriptional regulator
MRENAGISQAQLAKTAGVSRAMLSQVESEKKTPTARWMRAVMEAIARGLAGAA